MDEDQVGDPGDDDVDVGEDSIADVWNWSVKGEDDGEKAVADQALTAEEVGASDDRTKRLQILDRRPGAGAAPPPDGGDGIGLGAVNGPNLGFKAFKIRQRARAERIFGFEHEIYGLALREEGAEFAGDGDLGVRRHHHVFDRVVPGNVEGEHRRGRQHDDINRHDQPPPGDDGAEDRHQPCLEGTVNQRHSMMTSCC